MTFTDFAPDELEVGSLCPFCQEAELQQHNDVLECENPACIYWAED